MGRATALRLARDGYRVVVAEIDEERAASVAARDRRRRAPVRGRRQRGDGSRRSWQRALERFGRLDAMVANAGVPHGAPFLELDESHLGARARGQPQGRVPVRPGGGQGDGRRRTAGRDRQRREHLRRGHRGEALGLQRVQGRRAHADEVDGARARAARHPRQRRRARLDPHRHESARRSCAGRASSSRRSRWGASACRRTSPT